MKCSMRKLAFITICSLYFFFEGSAEGYVPPLEREVNLKLDNESVSATLTKIQEQTQVIFSYQASLLNSSELVSVTIERKTVREVLAIVLPKNIVYKTRDNYIILKEKPVTQNITKTQISGYVYDKTTEKKVPHVTIYDKTTLKSATTDEFGFYSMTVPAGTSSITVNKENYQDTIMALPSANENGVLNFTIQPKYFIDNLRDSLFWRERRAEVNAFSQKMMNKFQGYVHTINVKDTISRRFQVSFLPFVGTNHRLSGRVYNNLSFNVLGGYARGLNGFELAGLFNIEEENVSGAQIAGLFNIVGDSVRGSQIAGLMNINGKSVEGFQAASLMNINEGEQKGFQAAGLMNINERSTGTSVAGLMNISNSAKGAQIASLANINDTLEGIQVAGLFNLARYGRRTVQIAGLFNTNDTGTTHLQISSFVNTTSHLAGVQIGILNFADSASGIPLGLLSFVKKGIHQVELSADEVFYTNLSLRTGVNSFYNILSVGLQPGSASPLWQVGYGIGTSVKISSRWKIDLTGSVHHISKGQFYFAANELYKVYVGAEFKVGKKFAIAAGPTFNFYITDALLPDYTSNYSKIGPNPIFNHTDSYSYNRKGWVGARVALRFF